MSKTDILKILLYTQYRVRKAISAGDLKKAARYFEDAKNYYRKLAA